MTRLARVAALPLAALLLGGCGSADLHPGNAASVGSESLSQSAADRLTDDVCSVLMVEQGSGGTGGQRYANAQLQAQVVQSWVARAMADQLGSDYHVTAGTSYQQSLTQTKQQLSTLDDSVAESVLPTFTSTAYFVDVLSQIGRAELVHGGTASPSDQQSLTQGIDIAQAWVKKHPIETSPRLPDLDLGDDSFKVTADQNSVAVSTFAKEADATTSSADYLDSLPASQVCG